MHVLFDIGHPAHVHLFKNIARTLVDRGDKVTITIRDRGIVGALLTSYGFPYHVASVPRVSLPGLALELAIHDWNVLKACLPDRPDYLIGTSVSVAHVGKLIGRPSIVVNEDDADYVPLFAKLTYPFATRIVTPQILRDRKTAKYVCHNSYHELAYLHPDHFQADPAVLSDLGLKPGEPFSVVRLVSLTAHHDVGQTGITMEQAEHLVDRLKPYGRVLVNQEAGTLSDALKPYAFRARPEHMHSVLSAARLLVSDSQTMTMEAAVLGTPAFRCNTFVGQCSVIEELESTYGLAWGFRPENFQAMCDEIEAVMRDDTFDDIMRRRLARLLAEKDNLATWFLRQLDGGFATASR